MKYLFILVLLSLSTVVTAEPFRDGVVAYQQKKFQQAFDAWLPLAESGHVLAQTLIGSMYAYGEGIEQNDQQAFKWLSRAASTGSSQAQYNLAILYEKGLGIVADKAQALKWFKAAADQGRKDAEQRYNALLAETNVVQETQETPKIILEAKIEPEIPADNPAQPNQRIHVILNGNDSELLGPPTTTNINEKIGQAWVRLQPPNHYTIQLAASIEPRLIEAFKKHINLIEHYADTTSSHNGRQWHALIYGSYASVAEAKRSISDFPDSWKTWQPWIKKFSSVKHIKEQSR